MNTLFYNRSPIQAALIVRNLIGIHEALGEIEDRIKAGHVLGQIGYTALCASVLLAVGDETVGKHTAVSLVFSGDDIKASDTREKKILAQNEDGRISDVTYSMTLKFPLGFDLIERIKKIVVPTLVVRSSNADGREFMSIRAAEHLADGLVAPEGTAVSSDYDLVLILASVRMLINLCTLSMNSRTLPILRSGNDKGRTLETLTTFARDSYLPQTEDMPFVKNGFLTGISIDALKEGMSLSNTNHSDSLLAVRDFHQDFLDKLFVN